MKKKHSDDQVRRVIRRLKNRTPNEKTNYNKFIRWYSRNTRIRKTIKLSVKNLDSGKKAQSSQHKSAEFNTEVVH